MKKSRLPPAQINCYNSLNINTYLIKKLIQERPNFVSGTLLANELNISRVAIWSRINKLRNEGLNIEATQNLGYRYTSDSKNVNKSLVEAWLSILGTTDFYFHKFETVASTNSTAEQLLNSKNSVRKIVVISDTQSNGKGRREKNWISPSGGNLYMTIGIKPNINIIKLRLLTIIQAIRIIKLMRNEFPTSNLSLKWPNDIYLNGKKVGGILTEASIEAETVNSIILGIGINFYKKPKINDVTMKYSITSLKNDIKESFSLNEFTAKLIKTCDITFTDLIANKISKNDVLEWKDFDFLYGKEISIKVGNKHINGIARGINDLGELLVLSGKKTQSFNSGEISVV